MDRKDGKKSIIFPILHLIGVIGLCSYLFSSYDNIGSYAYYYVTLKNCFVSETTINGYLSTAPDMTSQTLLAGVFISLAVLTVFSILITKGAPAKSGLFMLFRVCIEVGLLIWLYFDMNDTIDKD